MFLFSESELPDLKSVPPEDVQSFLEGREQFNSLIEFKLCGFNFKMNPLFYKNKLFMSHNSCTWFQFSEKGN